MAWMDRLVAALAGTPEAAPPVGVPAGVRVVRGRWLPALGGRLSGMGRAAAAVTLGNVVVVHPETRLTPRLLRHELAHTRQWAERPVLFPLLYIARHVQYGYRDNPYEVEARQAEAEGCEDARPRGDAPPQ